MFIKHIAKTSYKKKAPFTEKELTAFIDYHFYNLKSLDKRTLRRMMLVEPATLLLMHDDPYLQANVNFGRAAMKTSKEILTISTPVTLDKHMKKLLRFLALGDKYNTTWPVLRIIERLNDEKIRKYAFTGKKITEEAVLQFYSDWKAGLLKPYYKSEDVPKENPGIVKTVVGKNFEEVVFDKMKDVVVFFHSVWCLECGEILLEYEKLAEKYSHISDLKFVKIDSFNNEGFHVPDATEGEPLMTIWRADDKDKRIDYAESYVLSEMDQFLVKELGLGDSEL